MVVPAWPRLLNMPRRLLRESPRRWLGPALGNVVPEVFVELVGLTQVVLDAVARPGLPVEHTFRTPGLEHMPKVAEKGFDGPIDVSCAFTAC